MRRLLPFTIRRLWKEWGHALRSEIAAHRGSRYHRKHDQRPPAHVMRSFRVQQIKQKVRR